MKRVDLVRAIEALGGPGTASVSSSRRKHPRPGRYNHSPMSSDDSTPDLDPQQKARAVAEKALQRLRQLQEQFPSP